MSVQIFLQARLIGIEPFLRSAKSGVEGRSHYVSLLTEVLPRALLAELGLSKMLLGSSGGEQFLLVLPNEVRGRAEEFLQQAAADVSARTNYMLSFVWSWTENLGDWSDVRKRLHEGIEARAGALLATPAEDFFEPQEPSGDRIDFPSARDLGDRLREAETVGWSPETPGLVQVESGKHQWPLNQQDAIPYARHVALTDDGARPASLKNLAVRSDGRSAWGMLRGDVDNVALRLRRAQTIEEHVQLSVMYKQFFAGELEVLCSMPEFWRKITLLYSGGDDFAVYGAWDALIGFAGEVHRLFSRFAETNLKDFVGAEGKTITMALAIAPAPDTPLRDVFVEAGIQLESAKNAGKDCFRLFGRTIEWSQLPEASGTQTIMTRMIREYGCSPQFLYELAGFYREAAQSAGPLRRGRADRVERPWRFHRRLNTVLGTTATSRNRQKEFEKLRTELISDFTGRRAKQIRLRPAGRVALEWARFQIEA